MEKEGVTPDVLVEPLPDDLSKGIDIQLEKAVSVLAEDVVAWKKREQNAATHPGGGGLPVPRAEPPAITPMPGAGDD